MHQMGVYYSTTTTATKVTMSFPILEIGKGNYGTVVGQVTEYPAPNPIQLEVYAIHGGSNTAMVGDDWCDLTTAKVRRKWMGCVLEDPTPSLETYRKCGDKIRQQMPKLYGLE